MPRSIVFRVDASLTIGSGHLIRCRNLARIFRDRGFDIYFIYRQHCDSIFTSLLSSEFPCFPLPSISSHAFSSLDINDNHYIHWLGCPEHIDSRDFLSLLSSLNIPSPEYLVVDHYAIGKLWEDEVHKSLPMAKLIVIDDLANRQHYADYLLDACHLYDSYAHIYQRLIQKPCRLLLGPNYALSTPEYGLLSASIPARKSLKRILIFFEVLIVMTGVHLHYMLSTLIVFNILRLMSFWLRMLHISRMLVILYVICLMPPFIPHYQQCVD